MDEDLDDDDEVDSDAEAVQEESAVESKEDSVKAASSLAETSDIEMEDESESSDDEEESRTREVSEKVIDFSQDETGLSDMFIAKLSSLIPSVGTSVATKQVVLDPVGLALGEKLIYSSKTRRDVLNAAWNRFA